MTDHRLTSFSQAQLTIGSWSQRTFNHEPVGIVNHLIDEAEELWSAVDHWNNLVTNEDDSTDKIAEEAADCAIMLLGLAHHLRFSLQDAIMAKHEVNLTRTWAPPDARGVTRHVKGGFEEPTAPAELKPARFERNDLVAVDANIWTDDMVTAAMRAYHAPRVTPTMPLYTFKANLAAALDAAYTASGIEEEQ